MNSKTARTRAFTLAELTVVIVIIGVLVALLLPAIIKGRANAVVATTKTKMNGIAMAIDQFNTDFGFYPPTDRAFNPATGAFDGLPYGDYGYSEALVQCLCNKFTKGVGDTAENISGFQVYRGTAKVMGGAPVTTTPYLEIKPEDLADKDSDGFPELVDSWGNAYIFVPKADYILASTGVDYNAGALLKNADGSNPDPSRLTTDTPPLNDPQQRFKYQLISLGPDGWTPGLDPAVGGGGYKYWDITLTGNPYPAFNPALVGTDTNMVAPVIDAALFHPDGTADDINNWD